MVVTGVRDRTILGPLTTAFTAPKECSTGFLDGLTAYLAQSCGTTNQQENTKCWPGTSSGAPQPTQPLQGWGFYSPAIMCPAGHFSACTATAGSTSAWQVEYSMTAGETAVGCCPTGFTCTADLAKGIAQTCIQYNTLGTVNFHSCSLGSTISSSSVLTGAAVVTAFAPMIQINWRAVDRGGSNVVTTTALATATPAASSSSSSSGKGMSTGATIGIAVGVSCGVLTLAILVGCMLFRRRRRMAGNMAPSELDGSGSGMQNGEPQIGGVMSPNGKPRTMQQTQPETSMPAPAYVPNGGKKADGYGEYRGVFEPPKELDSSPVMEPVEMMGSLPLNMNKSNMAELPVEARRKA